MKKKQKKTDIDNVPNKVKTNSKSLLKEYIENEEWFTVEDVRQFVKNNVREVYIANGDL